MHTLLTQVIRYETDRKASRCFCNDGYTGNGCGDEVKSDDNVSEPELPLCVCLQLVLYRIMVLFWGFGHLS